MRGQKVGARSLDPFAELPRTKYPRQPALGVRFKKIPVELCSSLVLLARTYRRRDSRPEAMPALQQKDLQRSQASRQDRTPSSSTRVRA